MVSHEFVRVEGKTATTIRLFLYCQKIDYYYQVRWYIDDEPLVMKDAVQNESIRNTNLGYDDKDKTKGYQKLGINVSYNTSKFSLLCVSFQKQIKLY